ncbi:hypothetical protein AAFC00_001891 [Neodothiora populina]|uniref:Rhodopsin domain-containing protein n=1 Tax=Neodothiora populina TaxID=2781224 RepID=A0ABR3PQV8_9PEZI
MSFNNVDGDDTVTGRVIAATVIGFFLPTAAVLARLIARMLKANKLFLDDYLLIAALMFHYGIDIAGCFLIENGLGRHIGTVSPSQMLVFLKVQYTGAILFPLCVFFTKFSILAQYRRLFATRFFRFAVDTIIVINVLWCISVLFTGIFLCNPVDKAWYPEKEGTCINLISFYYGLQIPNVLTDLAILVLPLKEVAELRLPKQQKIGVGLTCALWTLCLAFGIVRLVVMVRLSRQGSDVTYILANPAVWTTIEPTVGIITACLPSVRVLYRSIADTFQNRSTEPKRLHSLSDMSGTRTGQTLVGQPCSPQSKDYGDSRLDTRDNSSSAVSSPVASSFPEIKYTASSSASQTC